MIFYSKYETFTRDSEKVEKDLKKFSDAYQGQFLSSIALAGEHCSWKLHQYKFSFTSVMVKHVSRLQLVNGRIEDESSILGVIGELPSLEVLNLSSNLLTAAGIRKLVFKLLSMEKSKLRYLDISNNFLTGKSLKILKLLHCDCIVIGENDILN